MRKVHINGEDWKYRIGKQFIPIFDPSGKKFITDLSKVSGLSWDDIEKGQWKRYFEITPSMIKDYIEKEIL